MYASDGSTKTYRTDDSNFQLCSILGIEFHIGICSASMWLLSITCRDIYPMVYVIHMIHR